MPNRQYLFVGKKQKKRKKYSKEYLKVFEIIACLNGMYEALHIRS